MTPSFTSGQSAAHGKVMMGYTLNKDTEYDIKSHMKEDLDVIVT
jgi:hypothetical protein